MSDDAPLAPRDRARLDASRGAIHLMRVLLALGLLEGTAIVVDLATTELPTAALRGADTLRVLIAVALFVVGARLQGWADVLGFGLWLWLGRGFALLGIAAGVVRALGVGAPAGIPDTLWPPLMGTITHAGMGSALALTLYVVSRFAAQAELAGAGRALAWSTVPVIAAMVAGVGVFAPTLLPAWWVGGALVLATPWILAAARVLDWARALLPTLFIGTTLVLLTMFEAEPHIVAGLAAIAAMIIAAAFPRGPLASLHLLLGEAIAAPPSRTFIRRLLDGPLDEAASHLSAVESSAEDNLEFTYRELGIERPKLPPTRPTSRPPLPADAAPAPSVAFGPMAKLEPVAQRPVMRVVRAAPEVHLDATEKAAWTRASEGVRQLFLGFIIRAVTLIVAFVLSRGPLGSELIAILAAVAALTTGGILCLAGLWQLRGIPRRAHARTPATVAFAAAVVMVGVDGALALAIGLGAGHLSLLAAIGAGIWIIMIGGAIASLSQLFTDLDPTARRPRASAPSLLLGTYVTFASIATLAATSAESELTWLAIPSGIATALIGAAFFVSMLWLLTDARDALRDWQTRLTRAISPTAPEPPETPDP